MSVPFLDQYEPLDIIGNGAFGIIRKVRRKADGLIFARKELNFERMSERDRKQIVSEVNILKDLHHDHIVRYHDRHVDRDAGILYIMMEYCGGGDLSTVIKQAGKYNRPIPEDTIWNYFMQILLALHHCHHPNGHGRSGSGVGVPGDVDGKERRAQILHRDLKPDNVFLDEANTVKLGDFGLSKALAQASFANTYVGTPYYMSPELMQEKAYDTKSDIWSLGCLIYELCALKPPFHEAKTHTELSIFIRNGRIPPLPRGYSQSLSGVIKAMLNLNPAMRPSAAQLLQHERLELVFKVSETEKMLSTVKTHKSTVAAKEREILARESALLERENQLAVLLSQKDGEIAALQQLVAQLQHQQQFSQHDMEAAVKGAVGRREEELRVLVMKREEEVAGAMVRREEEIMDAVRRREAEVFEAWGAREAEVRKEVEGRAKELEEQVEWMRRREDELRVEEARLEGVRADLEEKFKQWEDGSAKGRKEKTPLEEVKNLLSRVTQDSPPPQPVRVPHPFPSVATPVTRFQKLDFMPSAMKGVVLTATGETLATPAPSELATLFTNSPKVGLNFAKIFDFDRDGRDEGCSPPPSPSRRKEKEKGLRAQSKDADDVPSSSDSGSSTSSSSATATAQPASTTAPPTRLRRPSIRATAHRPLPARSATLPSSASDPTGLSATPSTSTSSSSQVHPKPLPLPHPHLSHTSAPTTTTARSVTLPIPRSQPSPNYDFADEENLPSPFLKKTDRPTARGGSLRDAKKKRASGGNVLRTLAAANSAGKRVAASATVSDGVLATPQPAAAAAAQTRPALASARKASEDARKALLRPS